MPSGFAAHLRRRLENRRLMALGKAVCVADMLAAVANDLREHLFVRAKFPVCG